MAGEKLSARQKMIGMMYLVLTALLALQVSSSVLDKFILLNKSLERGVQGAMRKNEETLSRIRKTVSDTGSRTDDVKLEKQATQIREDAKTLITYIDQLKASLIQATGGEQKKNGYPKGLKNDAEVMRLMLDAGKASELKQKMNKYAKMVSDTTDFKQGMLALDAKDIEFFKDNPNQSSKLFEELNFEKTPLAPALATLTQFASEVAYVEGKALDSIAGKLGAGDVKFDKLSPIVRPRSNIVAAGTKYEADLLLTAHSSGVKPEMIVDGKPIPVKDGMGRIEFTASPGDYNKDGLARKTFKAAIKLRLPGNQSSVLTEEIEYFVAKPVIQVQSAAVQALYMNCGNELNVQVPSLGTQYNPRFTASGAEVVAPGGKKGLVTLVPNKAKVVLNVYNENNLLGKQEFGVRGIPKPEIVITSRGKIVNMKEGVPAPGPRHLKAVAVPDESFKTFLPKDARYRVANWEVTLARGSRAIKKFDVNGDQISLQEFAVNAQPGDRIVIEVKRVERLNFLDKVEPVNIGSVIHSIPLT